MSVKSDVVYSIVEENLKRFSYHASSECINAIANEVVDRLDNQALVSDDYDSWDDSWGV